MECLNVSSTKVEPPRIFQAVWAYLTDNMPPAVPRWGPAELTLKFSSHAAPGPNPSLFGRNEQSWPSTEELTLAPEEQIKVRFLGSWLLAAHRREIWRFWRFVI